MGRTIPHDPNTLRIAGRIRDADRHDDWEVRRTQAWAPVSDANAEPILDALEWLEATFGPVD